ncbi:MAG: Ig-like domain-containing protein [Gemmatimonadota bacterium]
MGAAFSFVPELPPGASAALHAAAIDVDNVHIVIRRLDGTVVLDTVVQFPPGVNEISFQATVPVRGLSEQFSALIQLRSGAVSLFEGTQQIDARPGSNNSQNVTVTTRYSGPGATATRVTITPRSTPLSPGGTVQLTAAVTDAAGTVFSGVPLTWTSSDPTVATVSSTGLVTALNKRGSTNLVVTLLSGLSDQVSASVTLPPAVTRLISGGSQSGRAGESLAQPLVVEVDAADGVPSAGVTVNFRATAGGGSVAPASAVTDANGRASTTLTLGGQVGSQTFEATATALAPISVSATATTAPAAQIAGVSGSGQSDTTGKRLSLPFVVRVTDRFGNAVSGADVTWVRTSGSGVLESSSTTTDATGTSGVAYTLGSAAGTETIVASIAAGASTSFSATAVARPASTIRATMATSYSGRAGDPGPTLGVIVVDGIGVPVAGVPITWSATGGATLAGPSTITGSDGRTSNTATFGAQAGASTITASLNASASVQFELVSVAGPPADMVIVAGDRQTANAGSAVAIRPAVSVFDANGNPITSGAVNFDAVAGGGTVTGSPATVDGSGVATVGSWILGPAGPQALVASAGSLSVTFTATSAPVGPPKLVIATQPSPTLQNGAAFATQPQVQLTTSAGAPVNASEVPVTVALASSGQTLGGSLTAYTNSNGLAVFNGLSMLGSVGTNQLVFTASGYASATSVTVSMTAGAPSQLIALSPTSLTGTVGTAASPVPTVALKDASGNPVAGQTVAFAAASAASGSVTGGSVVTNANGTASPTSWTLDAVPGKDTLRASFASVSGSPVTFIATTSSGAATQLVVVSGNGQTGLAGQTLTSPLVVELRDALNNPVPAVSVTFTVTGGGGTPTSQNVATGADGRANFSWTLGPAGPQTLSATAGALTAQFTATSTPASPPQLAVSVQPNASQQNATPFTTNPQVQLKDNAGGIVTTAGVPVTVALATSGQTLGGTLTAPTNSSGIAVFTDLSILGTVGTNQMVFTSAGYTSATSATFTITAGAPSQLTAVTPLTFSGVAGSAAAPTPAVSLADVSGNPIAGQTVVFAAASAASGTVTGGSAVTNASGAASPASWTLDAVAGKDTLRATFGAVNGSPVLFEATTTSGAATQIVIVSGNNQTGTTGQPLGAPLIVEARDANGNPVSGTNVTFTVSAGGGTPTSQTTSTSSGRASFTWTLGGVGNQSLQACLSTCAAQVTFSAVAIPVGADAIWTGSTSTSWQVGANWNPAVVPGSTSSVFIPSGTANAPALSSAVSVANLSLASGASLSIGAQNLDISGNLIASSAAITGSGLVRMTGSGKQLAGAIPALTIDAGGSVTAVATTTISGELYLANGTFDAGAVSTTVLGNLTLPTTSGSRLRMTNASASVTVTGNAYFNSADMGNADLTAGVLELRGNFIAERNYYQSFRASGSHTTRFNGTGSQSVSVYFTGAGESRFQNVEVSGTATLSGGRFPVGGLLTTTAGTSLGGLADAVLYGSGANFPLISGGPPPALYLASGGTVTLPSGATTYPGSLIVNSGTTLDIGGNSLTINGALTYETTSGARLKMTNSAARLIVKGDAYFNAADMGDGDLTAGILELRGNFTAERNYYQSFRASGTHVTKFAGSGPQRISVYYTGTGESRFRNVQLTGATLTGGRIPVAGVLTTDGSSSLAGVADVVVYGSGTTFPLVAGAPPPMIYLASGGTINAPAGSVTYPGNVTVNSSTTLDIGANALTIDGSLTYETVSGARLKMTNAAAHLLVKGDAYFNAADMGDADLTAGTLELRGNFTAERNYYQSFRATGAHLTQFTGGGRQNINIYYTGAPHSRFHNVQVTGTTSLGGGRVTVGGLLTTDAATSLAAISDLVVLESGATFPLIAGAPPPMVYLASGGTINAPTGSAVLPGPLTVNAGTTLDIGANSLTLNSSLTYETVSGARLKMTNAAARLTVLGDAYFNAADMGDGDLTAGVLELRGNFTAERNYYQSFRASGTHLTKFAGSGTQTVSTYYPEKDHSRFNNVLVTAGATLAGGRFPVAGLITTDAGTSLAGVSDVVVHEPGATLPRMSGQAPPIVYLASGGTISAPAGASILPTTLNVNSGTTLDIGANTLTITGGLNYETNSGARLKMNDAAGRLIVEGSAFFNASDMGDGDLTAGTLELHGHFTAERNFYQSFRASGTHLTKFNGGAQQNVSFYYPTLAYSKFQFVEFVNSSANGVQAASGIVIGADAAQKGRFATGSPLTVGGALTLGPTSVTNATGGVTAGSCSASPGASYTGFSCGVPNAALRGRQ